MQRVIPAINAVDFEGVERDFNRALRFMHKGGWIHIDVVDGEFAPHHTWNHPNELKNLVAESLHFAPIHFEIHLMVMEPEIVTESWLRSGANRLIVHVESVIDPFIILDHCDRHQAEVMLALNPKTPIERIVPYKNQFQYFQILAVAPGLAGQKFNSEVIDKIEFLRAQAPNATIEVDGGITPETAKKCKKAGADLFVSASYIFASANPQKAYQELLQAVSKS